MQLVRLFQNGEPVKVSKRTGKSITLATLLDEIPLDAARFFFNLRESTSQLDFDLSLAVEQSSQNPVYYVQYAHARICSILRNLKEEGVTPRACTREELIALQRPKSASSSGIFPLTPAKSSRRPRPMTRAHHPVRH